MRSRNLIREPGSSGRDSKCCGHVSIANTGGGGAHTILNPGLIGPWILRII
jgi:hypothetical protein